LQTVRGTAQAGLSVKDLPRNECTKERGERYFFVLFKSSGNTKELSGAKFHIGNDIFALIHRMSDSEVCAYSILYLLKILSCTQP